MPPKNRKKMPVVSPEIEILVNEIIIPIIPIIPIEAEEIKLPDELIKGYKELNDKLEATITKIKQRKRTKKTKKEI